MNLMRRGLLFLLAGSTAEIGCSTPRPQEVVQPAVGAPRASVPPEKEIGTCGIGHLKSGVLPPMLELYPRVVPLLIRSVVVTDAVRKSINLQLASTGDVADEAVLSRPIADLECSLGGCIHVLAQRAGCFDPVRANSPSASDHGLMVDLSVDALYLTRACPPTLQHTAVDGFFGIRDGSYRWYVELVASVSLRLFRDGVCVASSSATWRDSQLKMNAVQVTGATFPSTKFSPLVWRTSRFALERAWGDLLRVHFNSTQSTR